MVQYVVGKALAAAHGRVALTRLVTYDTHDDHILDLFRLKPFGQQRGAKVAALVHRHTEISEIVAVLEFGVHIDIRYVQGFQFGSQGHSAVLEQRRKHYSGRSCGQQVLTGAVEGRRVILVVAEQSGDYVQAGHLCATGEKTVADLLPILSRLGFRQQTCNHTAFLGSQQGRIQIRFIVKFLYGLAHLLCALAGHLSPVVQDPVHRAFRHAGPCRNVKYRYFLLFHKLETRRVQS